MTIQVSAPTDLSAVNRMLASVGQAPVTAIDTEEFTNQDGVTQEIQTNPEVAIAINTLSEVSREVQAMGWTFNFEYNVTYTPDPVTKYIQVPFNIIQMDASQNVASNRSLDLIRKNGRMWDRIAQTDQFENPIQFDIILMYNWEDLPIPIQDYIVAQASAVFAQRVTGDPQQVQMLEQKAMMCRTYALEYETQQGDYTFFGQTRNGNHYVSYEPFHALRR